MQSNFEKLTREELVIVEGENVLQPAAIQKVVMVMRVTVTVVRMIVMMITVMMTMLMAMLNMITMITMMMVNAQMLTLHNAVSKSRPPEIPLDEVCARSFTPASSPSSSPASSPCWN